MSTIKEILLLGDGTAIKDSLTTTKKVFRKSFSETEAEYDPYRHAVMDPLKRKKKKVMVPTGKRDENGIEIKKAKYVEVCRIAVPIQRLIVERTAGFLLGKPVSYEMNLKADATPNKEQKKLYDDVLDVFDKNKMKYFDKKLARAVFREREAAELWYFVPDENGHPTDEMRVQLLSPSRGDTLLPHFDDYGRMDAFGRAYKTVDYRGDTVHHFDVYTELYVYRYATDKNGQFYHTVSDPIPHGFDRIPVIYYRQEETEWDSVQPVCDRVDTLLSNWGDTNDYFGSPSYFFKGTLKGFAEKGEQGKVYQGDGEKADMKVLSWDSSPQSVADELANLLNIAFSYTQTPDLSFKSMKEIGSNTSGVSIRLMFTDPFMKADDKIELFGECFERRFNVVKGGIGQAQGLSEGIVESVRVEPKFEPYLPKNEVEELQMITSSTGGKATMSQAEGVRRNPLVKNPEAVMMEIKSEKADAVKEQQAALVTGASYLDE